MRQCNLPLLVILNPTHLVDIGVELDFIHDLVLGADIGQVASDLRARGMQGGPVFLGGKRERVENRRTAEISEYRLCDENGCIHIAGNSRVSINPPSTPDTRLSVEDTELIKTQGFLQPAAGSNTGLASPDDDDGVIRMGIFPIRMAFMNISY